MSPVLRQLLSRHTPSTTGDYERALREIMQQTILLGLWRAGFFERAAFYGGTALRLVHGLDRFSEDLDFSLLSPDNSFDAGRFAPGAIRELASLGIAASVRGSGGKGDGPINRLFICAGAVETMIRAGVPTEIASSMHPDRLLKIRLETDVDPVPGFDYEPGYLLEPVPFQVRCCSVPDLFAGKMHAVLCRRWRNRVKGRDWFDLVWFVAGRSRLHLSYLEEKMLKSGDLSPGEQLTGSLFRTRLELAVEKLDVESARREVTPFVTDETLLEVWSREFFHSLVERIQIL